jgi:hypothetical protein
MGWNVEKRSKEDHAFLLVVGTGSTVHTNPLLAELTKPILAARSEEKLRERGGKGGSVLVWKGEQTRRKFRALVANSEPQKVRFSVPTPFKSPRN